MEVPFLSSSAINREHYSLVRTVEAASTLQQTDDILVRKVEDVRRRFTTGTWTSTECSHMIILLLYCWTATSLGQVTRAMLEFALPHAVTLAEAGSTLKEKRTGYLFCTEIMSQSDELQLMLVNTLRKNLEDSRPTHICLALDVLLMDCPSEAIPAVTPRLIDILAHDSSHVRRKALAAIRAISRHEPEIWVNVHEKVMLRLKDPDPFVVDSALRLLFELTQAHIIEPHEAIGMLMPDPIAMSANEIKVQKPRLCFTEVVGDLISELLVTESESKINTDVMGALFRMIENFADSEHALVLGCLRTISRVPIQDLRRVLPSFGSKQLSLIGRLINSPRPNIQYFCVACLLELDVVLWAGTAGDCPPFFDESGVKTIMGFLDSPDSLIRIKTLQVLYRVDKGILLMHLTQLISALPSSAFHDEYRLAERALEVSAVYEQSGEGYANRLREVCVRVSRHEGTPGKHKATVSGTKLVSEDIVEQVLLHLRKCPDKFRGEFVDAVVRIPVSDAGPTLTLVITAVVCEYGALSTISQADLLRGLAERLEATPPAIQEALLLTMLRVVARCAGSTPLEVSDQVQRLHEISRRHIRRRCEQYLSYSERMAALNRIVQRAKSDTLPDFLSALETAETNAPEPSIAAQASPRGSEKPRSPIASGKLRYEAYEAPRPAPKHTHGRISTNIIDSHTTSSRSARSDSVSSSNSHSYGGTSRRLHVELGTDGDSDESLARTLTAGDLALVAHELNISKSGLISASTSGSQAKNTRRINASSDLADNLVSKPDLIALDSPFIAEPLEPLTTETEHHRDTAATEFEMIWDALKDQSTSRGWSESGTEELRQRLHAVTTYQVSSLPPDVHDRGEINIVVSSWDRPGLTRETGLFAAVRLRPGEEGSALWQMRCLEITLKAELRKLLDD